MGFADRRVATFKIGVKKIFSLEFVHSLKDMPLYSCVRIGDENRKPFEGLPIQPVAQPLNKSSIILLVVMSVSKEKN